MEIIKKEEMLDFLNRDRDFLIEKCYSLGLSNSFLKNDCSEYLLFYFILANGLFKNNRKYTVICNSAYYWLHLFGLKNPDINKQDIKDELSRVFDGIEVKNEQEWQLLHNNFNPDIELF